MAVTACACKVGVAVMVVPPVLHNEGVGEGQYEASHDPPSKWHFGVAPAGVGMRTLHPGVAIEPVADGCACKLDTRQL
jgi:hypothetical protein